jgi:hypothetical protein
VDHRRRRGRRDADEQQMLHRYAIWHVVRRLRGRLGGADTTHEQVVAAQRSSMRPSTCWTGSPITG